jgi:integrase
MCITPSGAATRIIFATAGGTERSRRTLGLPVAAVQALHTWRDSQTSEQLAAGQDWQDTDLVFTSHLGAALDAANVRKMFKRICTQTGTGDGSTPRELRTTFVSLMSHQGVSIEEIARLAGHASTRTTEIVYRRELRPVITTAPKSWTRSSQHPCPVLKISRSFGMARWRRRCPIPPW